MQVEISHSEPLGAELPKQWSTFWRQILTRQAATVYLWLRANDGLEADTAEGDTIPKMSKYAFDRALQELKRHGFVSLGDGL